MKSSGNIRLFLISLSIIFLGSGLFQAKAWAAQPQQNMQEDKKGGAAPQYKDGELLVKFKEGVPEKAMDQIHATIGATKIKRFEYLHIDLVGLPRGMAVAAAEARYHAIPFVEYSEPNYQVHMVDLDIPNDPLFSQMWDLYNTGQNGGTPGADIDAPSGWACGSTGSANVVVAVIDTGVDYTHPDLMQNMWKNPGEIAGISGVDDDHDGYVDDVYGINAIGSTGNPFDDCGHGTHVAGIIGAVGDNGVGVTGVNWDVGIMACKFLDANGYGYTAGAITCLEYVRKMKANGVNIVATNNSWGGSGYSQALYDAINAQRDILFMAAAGNQAADNDRGSFYPAEYYLPNVIAVAATDNKDNRASFSNYGRRSVSVGAPGGNILSAVPAVNLWGITGGYGVLSGTSMATPHVSGLAALIKAEYPTDDWRAIRNLVLTGGENVPSLTNLTITGKRINVAGSLNCYGSAVFSALGFPDYGLAGIQTTLSALSINCANSVGPVTVVSSAGETVTLHDDGIAPDIAAGDGIFSAIWRPSLTFSSLTFSSPAGTETIVPTVPTVVVPLASGILTVDPSLWRVTLVDTSTATSNPLAKVTVAWGDGLVTTQGPGTTFTHNYLKSGSYGITQTAVDTTGLTGLTHYDVTLNYPKIVGHVYKKDGITPISGAYVWVTRSYNGVTNTYITGTKSDGSFAYSNLGPGSYSNLRATKSGYTFWSISTPNTTGGDNVIKAVNQ
jgi:thermitase